VFQGGRRLQRAAVLRHHVAVILSSPPASRAGIGRLQASGLLPGGDPLWDTSWLLDDHRSVGGFLAGLVGYRARPSGLEITGYVLYLAAASFPSCGGSIGAHCVGPAASRSRQADPDEVTEPSPPASDRCSIKAGCRIHR